MTTEDNQPQKVIWLVKEGETLPLKPGAIILRTGHLAHYFIAKGYRVIWFSSAFDHGTKSSHCESTKVVDVTKGLQLILCKGFGYKKNISLSRILHHRSTAKEFRRITKSLPAPVGIVVSYPTPELLEEVRKYSNKTRVPYVLDTRDPWPDSFPITWKTWGLIKWYRRLLKLGLKNAAGVVSMSNSMLAWTESYMTKALLNLKPRKVFFLGHEHNRFRLDKPSCPQSFSKDNPLKCVFYGSFGKVHNGEVLVRAANLLKDEFGEKIQILFVGDGDLRKDWENLAKGNNAIHFLGWKNKEESAQLLNACHIGIIAISGEINKLWFGNKFFEYLAAGLAVINDTQGELQALIEEKRLGMNVEMNNPNKLADAIRSYFENPSEVEACSINANTVFDNQFSVSSIYPEFVDFVVKCCEKE